MPNTPTIRLDDAGHFDEFVSAEVASIHFEMMDDATLWCGIDHPDGSRHVLWIRAERGKLSVNCDRDT